MQSPKQSITLQTMNLEILLVVEGTAGGSEGSPRLESSAKGSSWAASVGGDANSVKICITAPPEYSFYVELPAKASHSLLSAVGC